MSKNISTGIDIGTYQTRVVVSEADYDGDKISPKVIGIGCAESRGLRHGYIVSQNEVAKSIKNAVAQAEKMSGEKIKRATFSIGGIGLTGTTSNGTIITSRADYEITSLDLNNI
jgi:cell division protein FtsA